MGGQSVREIKLPKSGYFAMADPNQEIYSKATEPFDPRKKGGRYKNEFIWNTNWQETLSRDEQLEKKRREFVEKQRQGSASGIGDDGSSGGVKLGMLADLNRMDLDLSAALLKKAPSSSTSSSLLPRASSSSSLSPPQRQQQAAAALEPLSRLNVEKLKRQNRGASRTPTVPIISTRTEDEVEKDRLIKIEREKYEAKKVDFLIWTLALTAMGGAATYTSYSADTAASYMAGALGGLVYLRLLSRSVDAVGAQSLEGGLNSALSQPRLLIPIVLALVYNRWNVIYADKFDITLQLLPMLLGFFTYKIAVLAREATEVLADLNPPPKSGQDDR